ncbi:hypothetical protein SAMN03159422_05243 [Agrobacterium fabrum]|nr:hypothetical protein SAMN03159422_05243 [Agrobacterium fabrum]SES23735.1 hypothetical protein SAMN03159504_05238 [Agrobacterium fabrum]
MRPFLIGTGWISSLSVSAGHVRYRDGLAFPVPASPAIRHDARRGLSLDINAAAAFSAPLVGTRSGTVPCHSPADRPRPWQCKPHSHGGHPRYRARRTGLRELSWTARTPSQQWMLPSVERKPSDANRTADNGSRTHSHLVGPRGTKPVRMIQPQTSLMRRISASPG